MANIEVSADDRIDHHHDDDGASGSGVGATWRKRLGRWTVRILSFGFILALVGVVGVFFVFWFYGRDLPSIAKLPDYEPPIVSRVYAGDGRLVGEFAAEKRVFVPLKLIPKTVIDAFLASEDKRFYSHNGVDLLGLLRAGITNVRNYGSGRGLVGGSTITQQVAKNFLLTSDKKIDRKVKEIILALRIEAALPKSRILELYLNEIYLGHRAYGVAAAAQVYFNKSLRELATEELAMLAGMPQAPSRYDPFKNPTEARRRRDYVIGRLYEDGKISAAERDRARSQPIKLARQKTDISGGAEYFVEEVRRILLKKYGEKNYKLGGYSVRSTVDPILQRYADDALRKGLVTYDRRHGFRGSIVNFAEKHGENWAEGWKKKLAAVTPPAGHGKWPLAVVLEVEKAEVSIGFADGRRGTIPISELRWARKQGEIRRASGKLIYTARGPIIRKAGDVLKQGDVILVEAVTKNARRKDYPKGTYTLRQIPIATGAIIAMDPHTGRVLAMSGGFSFWVSQFNTVTQAFRQPGSSFKPFVYLTALENGFTPSTLVLDAPIVVKLAGGRKYKPRNSSGKFYGPTTLRRGLELSRNVMTVRLAERVGLEKVSEMAIRMGIAKKLPPTMAMALGAYETTPIQMATAYSMIVNGGRRVVPTLIDRIQDRYGKTVFRHETRACLPCKASDWKKGMPELKDSREIMFSEQSAFQLVSIMQGVVSRGTATRVSVLRRPVAGKTGTTNDVVDAWFVGFTPNLVVATWVGFEKSWSLGYREEGGRTAAPIFRDFMLKALGNKEKAKFRRPEGLFSVRVSLDNGKPGAGGKRAIYEYFKKGEKPGDSPDGLGPGGSSDSKVGDTTGDEY